MPLAGCKIRDDDMIKWKKKQDEYVLFNIQFLLNGNILTTPMLYILNMYWLGPEMGKMHY